MSNIIITFYGELNDFLPDNKKHIPFSHSFIKPSNAKDLIESIGIPHTEIDVIVVNNYSVDLSNQVNPGDDIHVYPIGEQVSTTPIRHLSPLPLEVPAFVLDVHLGKLARYLRMVGLDTLYQNDYWDEVLAKISNQEDRTLLTRDRGLLKRSLVNRGYFVRNTIPRKQLIEIIKRFHLANKITPFTRCIRCNGLIKSINKTVIQERLLQKTRQYYDEFQMCGNCGQIYWKGSHYKRMCQFLNQVVQERKRI